MKIVCDACQAKYSISDDKVQGKVFKIRCKKCSNIIVVRGGANAVEAAPAPQQETNTYDYGYSGGDQPAGDEPVWHVVINQDQVGPMTAADVQARFASGEIDAETYIWREGFTDWLPMSQVDTFASFAAGGGAAPAAHAHAAPAMNGGGDRGGANAVAAMFGGGAGGEEMGTTRSDPGDLFAAASATSQPPEDDGNDLFGSRRGAGDAAAAQAQGGANSKLRGERNENSVLFSLNNLAQLASDKPAQPGVSMQSMPSGHATGAAGGEGSGLIDIRSMASAYLGGGSAGAAKATTSSIGTIDDLPVFGGGGFSEPAVIVPTARPAANNKILYAMIGAVGLLAIAAVVMVVVLLGGKDNKAGSDKTGPVATNDDKKIGGVDDKADKPVDKPADPPKDTPKSTDNSTKPADGSGSGSATQVAVADTPKPADPPKDTPKPADPPKQEVKKADPPKQTPPKDTPKKTDPPKQETKKTDPPKKDETKKDDKKVASGDCDEVSCVLNNNAGACCAKFKKGGNNPPSTGDKKPPTSGDLPETLDRDMISAGVGSASGAAKACGNRFPAKGKVKVHVKVAPAGNVTDVSVSETPDASLGGCVQAAMSRAHFAKTQKGGSFAYPFVF